MEINDATKLLAYGFVSELIKKKKIRKDGQISSAPAEEVESGTADIAEVSFGDLENYYRNVVSIIENTPEIRQSIVDALNEVKNEGRDLNEFYPSRAIADELSLKQVLFMNTD